MSLDKVLAANQMLSSQSHSQSAISSARSVKYERPSIASTRAWVFDTEKLVQNVKYAEQSAKEMRSASSRVLSRDKKECQSRARRVDNEVKSVVETTAMTSHTLEKAIALHESELVKLLQDRNAARSALALVHAPLEKVRKRIQVRLQNPLPLEERTDTSVLESLQIVSRALSQCSKSLIAYVKEAERHCTHMESLRQAIRSEINDRHDSMKVTFAGSHEITQLPPIPQAMMRSAASSASYYSHEELGGGGGGAGGGGSGAAFGHQSEYAQMLKTDITRCLRLSQSAIAESVLLRSKMSQCVKDITIVRKRNEKLLDHTLEEHVKEAHILQKTLSGRKKAVESEIERLKQAETEAKFEHDKLVAPSQMASEKLRDRTRYARVLRDGRSQDSVSLATFDEAIALHGAVKDAERCEHTLAKHRERLEGFLEQLSHAEQCKARVLEVAIKTKECAPVAAAALASHHHRSSLLAPRPPPGGTNNKLSASVGSQNSGRRRKQK